MTNACNIIPSTENWQQIIIMENNIYASSYEDGEVAKNSQNNFVLIHECKHVHKHIQGATLTCASTAKP